MKSMGGSYKTDGHGNAEFIKLSNDDVSTTIPHYSTHLQYYTTAYYNIVFYEAHETFYSIRAS